MPHVGIVAHSIEGASLCLRTCAQVGIERLGPHDHPDVTLDCIALAQTMDAWESGDHARIREVFASNVERLAAAGAEFFVLPDNTAHIALETPGPDFALPALHIAEVLAERAAGRGYRRVGLLGTKYLVDSAVYPRALNARGIAAELPSAEDREFVNTAIFDELVPGVFASETRDAFVRIIGSYKERGCDAVALVCTEIPILISPEDSPLPTLDSTRLLAAAAVAAAVGDAPFPTWRGGPVAVVT